MGQVALDAFADRPAFDIAVSDALLRGVAAGATAPVTRVFVPGPTLAFGKLDRLSPGFGDAVAAARARGFEPVVRLAGGRAAAYDGGSLIVERVVRVDGGLGSGLSERFAAFVELLAGALRDVGADARVGALPGEYCPGEWSVNVGGAVKVVGVAQRVVRGAALVSAVVVVAGGDRIREALVDVYAALGLDWSPSTAGSLDGVRVDAVRDAVLRRLAAAGDGAVVRVDAGTLAAAEGLVAAHTP